MQRCNKKYSLSELFDKRLILLKNIKWQSWTTILGVSDNGLKYFVSLFFYTLFSLLFSLSAASLVKMFAPYACGSGIPEVIEPKS
jgi:H+/Cl- antiporter ClcA